jgi:hypothetical protein
MEGVDVPVPQTLVSFSTSGEPMRIFVSFVLKTALHMRQDYESEILYDNRRTVI